MAKQRLSINLDKPTAAPAPVPTPPAPAPAPAKTWQMDKAKARASNVALPIEQWKWIDQSYTDVLPSWGTVRKNNIIQALVLVAMERKPDFTGAKSLDDLVAILKQSFGIVEV